MIPALIIWLFKKIITYRKSKHTGTAAALLVFAGSFMPVVTKAQIVVRNYDVIYKGDNVGTVQLHQHIYGETIHYRMISDVKTRFIFKINVHSVEESTFRNGKLVHSAVNRTVNGNEKVRRQTSAGHRLYNIVKEGEAGVINNENINFNVMRLYCTEPTGLTRIYSDNHQQFMKLTRIAAHTYKLYLPDGNYNFYTYNNGICTKVEVFSSM